MASGNKLVALLWGRYRGLAFYAPILLLAVPGWFVLIVPQAWNLAAVTFRSWWRSCSSTCLTRNGLGGWSTGPRTPGSPVAIALMLPAAALLSGTSRTARVATIAAVVLALAGGVLMLAFQAVGGRIPQSYTDPLIHTVWPVCTARTSFPGWRFDGHALSAGTSRTWFWLGSIDRLPPGWQFVQFAGVTAARDHSWIDHSPPAAR